MFCATSDINSSDRCHPLQPCLCQPFLCIAHLSNFVCAPLPHLHPGIHPLEASLPTSSPYEVNKVIASPADVLLRPTKTPRYVSTDAMSRTLAKGETKALSVLGAQHIFALPPIPSNFPLCGKEAISPKRRRSGTLTNTDSTSFLSLEPNSSTPKEGSPKAESRGNFMKKFRSPGGAALTKSTSVKASAVNPSSGFNSQCSPVQAKRRITPFILRRANTVPIQPSKTMEEYELSRPCSKKLLHRLNGNNTDTSTATENCPRFAKVEAINQKKGFGSSPIISGRSVGRRSPASFSEEFSTSSSSGGMGCEGFFNERAPATDKGGDFDLSALERSLLAAIGDTSNSVACTPFNSPQQRSRVVTDDVFMNPL
jgi:hypothetical protein